MKIGVFGQQRQGGLDGAVLGAAAFVLRFFGNAGDDRVVDCQFRRGPAPQSRARAAAGPPARMLLAVALVERRPRSTEDAGFPPGNGCELEDSGTIRDGHDS